MQEQSRPLAYSKAIILSDDDLKDIAGGTVKYSTKQTYQVTGSHPGNVDGVTDQVWD